jgi:hypothetical protein
MPPSWERRPRLWSAERRLLASEGGHVRPGSIAWRMPRKRMTWASRVSFDRVAAMASRPTDRLTLGVSQGVAQHTGAEDSRERFSLRLRLHRSRFLSRGVFKARVWLPPRGQGGARATESVSERIPELEPVQELDTPCLGARRLYRRRVLLIREGLHGLPGSGHPG